jgi:tetratricopeptide (TPR) repeat protein
MWSEAAGAVDRLASLAPDIPEVAQFQRQILAAMVAESAKHPEPPVEVEPPAPPAMEVEAKPPAPEIEEEPAAIEEVGEPEQPRVAEFTFDQQGVSADSPGMDVFAIEESMPVLEATAEPALPGTGPAPEIEEEEEPLLQEPPQPPELTSDEAASAPMEVSAEAEDDHDVLEDFVSDLEASLGDNFLGNGNGSASSRPASAPVPPVSEPAVAAFASAPAVIQIPAVSHNIPQDQPAIAAVAAVPAIAAASAVASAPETFGEEGTSLLQDLFEEFKEDMEEGAGQSEDPETHYNLGVAFKEMGLLDEAIGELQKVCQAIDHGQPFSQKMQAFTWLANCFLEKGVPEASFKWYQKALSEAGNEETRTAIHYELACAYEAALMKAEALRHFMEVYSANIDYRDVAERIKHLKS